MAAKSLSKILFSQISTNQIARTGFVNCINVNFYSGTAAKQFELVKVHKAGKLSNVGVITLNSPKMANVLNSALMKEIAEAINTFEKDKEVGAIVLTGEGKFFSAGADINQMKNAEYSTFPAFMESMSGPWEQITRTAKPIIAACNGITFGAGCELVMTCDIIYAAENAIFGQPEIKIGTFPGAGGTQRLTRAVGKSKAMEMMLSGEPVSAQEAEKMGLVSKVFPNDKLLEESVKLGEKIARNSHLINGFCKEAINTAYETTLKEGLHFERILFHGTFATKDRKEGMTAFIEKRPPKFTNE